MFQRIFIFCFLLIFTACGNAPKDPATADSGDKSAVGGGDIDTRVTVKDNGVLIDYTDTKKGDTVLLFVHGWGINKNYFADQVNYFQDRYRVVTVDLPGYGQSGKNRNSWTVSDFGRDLDSVMAQLNLDEVILVGHSMSGDIVLDAALQAPRRVIGLVGIDNFKSVGKPADPKEEKQFAEAMKSLRTNYTAVVTQYFNSDLFSKYTDSATRKRVLNDVTHSDSAVATATMEAQGFDENAALKNWKRPLYLINSDYQPTDTSGLHRQQQPFHLSVIARSGHFPMIEKPEDFNKALQETIDLIATGVPAANP